LSSLARNYPFNPEKDPLFQGENILAIVGASGEHGAQAYGGLGLFP